MSRSVCLASQWLLIGFALAMAVWVGMSMISIAGLSLLGASLAAARWKNGAAAAWICSVLAWAGCVDTNIWDLYFAIVAGLMAAALWVDGPTRSKTIAITWSFLAGLIAVGAGYVQNAPGPFYFGLLASVTWLIFLRARFQLPPMGVQLANTILLVLVGLPLADFFVRPDYRLDVGPGTCWKYYSYEGAKGNPSAFARWWQYYQEQTDRTQSVIFQHIPGGDPSFRLRPKSHALLFQSPVFINSQGFRGPEIPLVKGQTYRIVALGESTTFGMTMAPEDQPWPALLEEMIRQRLQPSRPAEVINAGIPAYGLKENLGRLASQILPLQPDMIISYHGYNSFRLLNPAVPPPKGPPPPRYRSRPLKLLADAEYRVKMVLFRHGYAPKLAARKAPPLPPLDTPYAALYRQLIQVCQTNDIRLVLANFSMAVNKKSDPQVIEFYRSASGAIYTQMQANEMHSALLAQLAARQPDVCLVDTHPHLDGEHQKFIDPIHFTQEGRRQLAENIFAGIRDVLQQDWQRRARKKSDSSGNSPQSNRPF